MAFHSEDFEIEVQGKTLSVKVHTVATMQFPTEQMQACTIEKEFRDSIEPTKPYSYEDLPALELAIDTNPGKGPDQLSLF